MAFRRTNYKLLHERIGKLLIQKFTLSSKYTDGKRMKHSGISVILVSFLTVTAYAQCWHNLFPNGIKGFNLSDDRCLTVLKVPKEKGDLYELAASLCEKEVPGGSLFYEENLPVWKKHVQFTNNETVFFNLKLFHMLRKFLDQENTLVFAAKYARGILKPIPYHKQQVVWVPKVARSAYLPDKDLDQMYKPDESSAGIPLPFNPVCIIWRVGTPTTSLSPCNETKNVDYIVCESEPAKGCKPKSSNFSDGCESCPSRKTGKYCQYEARVYVERKQREQNYTQAIVLACFLSVVLVGIIIKLLLFLTQKMKDRDIKSPGPFTGSKSGLRLDKTIRSA
uniref:C-type lectin domain-containing protein n=1 Tax=Trichuris muris TaxID=70415 RepID=A0A5S6R176_TRIMR